jgi:hypothetical protein
MEKFEIKVAWKDKTDGKKIKCLGFESERYMSEYL